MAECRDTFERAGKVKNPKLAFAVPLGGQRTATINNNAK